MSSGVRRDLFGAAAVMMAAFLLSRVTGLLRTVAISYRFGTGPELSAYLAANRLSDTMFQIVAGGAVSAAFIPVLASYLSREDRAEAWRLVSALFTLSIAILLPLCVVLGLFAPQVMAIAGGFDDSQRLLAADLLRILLISPIVFALGTFATSVLNANQRFLLAALAPSIYNLGIIFGALVLSTGLGVHGLAIGASLGAVLYLVVQLPGLVGLGMRYRPWLGVRHEGVRRVARLMAPRTLGLAVTQLNFLAIVVLASPLPGGIAALEYAWTLMMLPLGLFAMAISTAVFPTLAEQTARDELNEMTHTLAQTLRVILYLTLPASAGLIVLGRPIVQLLLERGEFTAASTDLTVTALHFYAVGLVGQAIVEIVTRAFYALQDTRTPVLVAALAMATNLGLALALRPTMGHGGLALALSAAALVEALLLVVLARRRLTALDERRVVVSALRSALGAALVAVALVPLVVALDEPLAPYGWLGRGVLVGVAVGVGAIVYLLATAVLRAEELTQLIGAARRRVRA